MPSPFPGMDPFLESQPRWEIFHGWFIRELARLTLPRASSMGCWIDVERDVYGEDPSGAMVSIGEPDQVFSVTAEERAWNGNGGTVATLALPRSIREVVVDPDEAGQHRQQYLVVRDNQSWPRTLAVVELLSPANKSGKYAKTYNEKRAKLLAAKTHFMEIDLLRGGVNPLRDHFPDLAPTPYFVFVARKNMIGRNEEGFPLRLQDALPTIGLPLWGERPDLPLELGAAFQSAYELTTGGRPINYSTEALPPPPLSPDDAAWTESLLKQPG
jgi:Protein of unknown function (DUF4058)